MKNRIHHQKEEESMQPMPINYIYNNNNLIIIIPSLGPSHLLEMKIQFQRRYIQTIYIDLKYL